MDQRDVIRRSVQWFRRSGIMRPADGSRGVAERILITTDNEAIEKINHVFPCQRRLSPELVVLEHRRADCNFQVALLFDLAAEALGEPACRAVAGSLVRYLVQHSGLRRTDAADPRCGLWGWSNPVAMDDCWTDDNAWVTTLALVLARRGRPELREIGIAAGRALNRLLQPIAVHLRRHGKDAALPETPLLGTNLSPHWLGLVTMALAHAAAADRRTDYSAFVDAYYAHAASAPPREDASSRPPAVSGQRWTLSEYGYLALAGAIAARQFDLPAAAEAARTAADALVAHQQDDGHFPAEYAEAPMSPHVADLVYTQNWATLGLYHAWRLFGAPAQRRALDASLAFLARIQDRRDRVELDGCWRGAYDTRTASWGGGDTYEGGQNSIYSGWTNAPLALAFAFDATGAHLFAET